MQYAMYSFVVCEYVCVRASVFVRVCVCRCHAELWKNVQMKFSRISLLMDARATFVKYLYVCVT